MEVSSPKSSLDNGVKYSAKNFFKFLASIILIAVVVFVAMNANLLDARGWIVDSYKLIVKEPHQFEMAT